MTLDELANLGEDLLNELRKLNENFEKNNRLLELTGQFDFYRDDKGEK